jgi:uncharacterized damage-inducible protein DinB
MFDINRVRSSWQREAAAIDAIIENMSADTAQQPIREDGWTIQEIVGHIASTSRASVRQLQPDAVLPSGSNVDLHAFNEEQRQRDQQRAWSDVQSYWQRAREEVTEFLELCDNSIAEQPVHLSWVPQVQTAGDLLKVLILHTRSHREELERGSDDHSRD